MGGQLLNILLDICWIKSTAVLRRFEDLCNQLRMCDGLAALHDAHDGRLCLVVAICGDSFVRRLVLFLGLLELDLVDFYAHLWVGEGRVIGECVGVIYVSTFWFLGEDSVLGACEGLEGSF